LLKNSFNLIFFSNAMSWGLYALSQDQRVQAKLREELYTIDTDNPTMDQLNTLPYLDMVLREILRVHPSVPSIGRMALKDDILPLSKPVIDRQGKVHENIRGVDLRQFHIVRWPNMDFVFNNRIKEGQILIVSIVAVNRDKAIWGEDADDFRQVIFKCNSFKGDGFYHCYRPERWESIPEASSAIPSVWGNMLTFSGGSHACIGFRFALIE
jgi:cytochrome P450